VSYHRSRSGGLFPRYLGFESLLRFQEVIDMADVTMPMNGKVIAVKVQVGQAVGEDDEVVIIEAMKMELPIVTPVAGTVKEIKAKEGDSYQVGDVLVVIG
jgi:acetyl-CoA carboxylase biotin carboxyl carrier protein